MTERLDEGAESEEPRRSIWDKVLEHDDDTELAITITNLDGSNPRGGTLRVGAIREQMASPRYQALMRGAHEHLQELRERGELPLPETIPENPQA